MSDFTPIEKMLVCWEAAKHNEEVYKAERIALEAQMTILIGLKPEGQKTVPLGSKRITVKRNVAYSLNLAEWENIKSTIPQEHHPFKLVLDEPKVRALKRDHPAVYTALAMGALSSKENKPSFHVTEKTAPTE